MAELEPQDESSELTLGATMVETTQERDASPAEPAAEKETPSDEDEAKPDKEQAAILATDIPVVELAGAIEPADQCLQLASHNKQCGCIACRQVRYQSYWYAGVDLTALDPSYSNSDWGITNEEDGSGARVYFGWESASGAGIRSRIWSHDGEYSVASDTVADPAPLTIDAFRWDIDFYRRFRFRRGDVELGASLTGASLEFDTNPLDHHETDSAFGVGFFAEGRHTLFEKPWSRWSLLTRGRWAYLTGEWTEPLRAGRTRGDLNLDIRETFLGLEYVYRLKRCEWVFQTGFEAQAWDSNYLGNVSFDGSTTRIGMNW
ncbi:MAG: hypothetical protein AAGA92_12605 [Planctomycetota bacterium]